MGKQPNSRKGKDKMAQLKEHLSYLSDDRAGWDKICSILGMIQKEHLEEYADDFVTDKHPESADEFFEYYLILKCPYVVISDEEVDYDEIDSYVERIMDGLQRFDHSAKDYIRIWDDIIRCCVQHRYEERMAAFVEAYPTATYEQVKQYCDYLWSKQDLETMQSCDDGSDEAEIPNLQEMISSSRAALEKRSKCIPELLALTPHSYHHNYEFHVPMSEEDFQLFVTNILRALEYKPDSYISISLKEEQGDGINCIQGYPNEDGKTQHVEILTGPEDNWRSFSPKKDPDFDEALLIYREILIDGVHPDLSTWVDHTDEIRKSEKDAQE